MRPLRWRPDAPDSPRLREVLVAWEGTPYAIGQQRKHVGVDCVRFVCGVLDELRGTSTAIASLPDDVALHDPVRAEAAMRRVLELFPADEVDGGAVEPGDVVVMRPEDGGPAHAMIAGAIPRTLYHATPSGVVRTGLGFAFMGWTIARVLRLKARPWL